MHLISHIQSIQTAVMDERVESCPKELNPVSRVLQARSHCEAFSGLCKEAYILIAVRNVPDEDEDQHKCCIYLKIILCDQNAFFLSKFQCFSLFANQTYFYNKVYIFKKK